MAPESRSSAVATRPLCFAIGPYGEANTETRKWSDFLFEKIVRLVVDDRFDVQRTIDAPEPGRISDRIERDLNEAAVVIADLTNGNPNVYFEMGYRRALKLPLIHVARAGTRLPFDVQDYEVVWINADYVDRRDGYFTISDGDREAAQTAIRKQLDKASLPRPPVLPAVPVSAKVYDWQVWYSRQIHVHWLETQEPSFREAIARYEKGEGAADIGEGALPLFAEYLALKHSASVAGTGTIFLTILNQIRQLDLGYAVFRFAKAMEPLLIRVVDVACGSTGIEWIRFEQPSRLYPVEVGGQQLQVTIPGYNYTLELRPQRRGTWEGTINHPETDTRLGRVELRAKYGEAL